MFQAQLGQMMSGMSYEDYDKDDKSDPKCKSYSKWQADGCECEDESTWEETNDKRLKTFY
jgi:hypothetical protein